MYSTVVTLEVCSGGLRSAIVFSENTTGIILVINQRNAQILVL